MKNIVVNNVVIHGGTLIDGLNIPGEKPVDGFTFSNVTGICTTGISLANVVNAKLENINVTGFNGPLLAVENVTGTGLEKAVAPAFEGFKQLERAFNQPTDDARPQVRWWWFGPNVTKPELLREMQAMKTGGFGGFEVQPTYPLTVEGNQKFLSPEFLDDLNYVAAQAKELGLRMDLTLGSGWPYGGPMFPITESAGCLRISHSADLREGETLLNQINGTYFIASHTGMKVKRPALGAEGYVIDHDNPAVVAKFVSEIANKEIQACGTNPPYSIFCDSLESYKEDWTDNFLAEFQKRRGYDLRPLLPALIGDIGPKTAEVRHDWGQTLTELFNDSFVKPLHAVAQESKTRFRIQAYGTPSAGLFSYADADLPEGEGYQWHGYRATRYASSASHLMGLPVTSSEAFTWLHSLVFRATPLDIKAEADLHFLQGVNQLMCHGWPYTPPGMPIRATVFMPPQCLRIKIPGTQ